MAGGWAEDATEASTTTTTAVPILRQVNDVNEDGTYTYGFEAADGTFKLETRDENGNVKGKYGFLDEFGELKIVEYSAGNETGFVPTSDLLPKPVPVPEVPQIPQPLNFPTPSRPQFNPQRVPQSSFAPRSHSQSQFTPHPQQQPQLARHSQPRSQFAPHPQPQIIQRPQQPQFVPRSQSQTQPQLAPHPQQPQFTPQSQLQFLPQQFRPQSQVPRRPVKIDGFSEDTNGFVDSFPEGAAMGNPFLSGRPSPFPAPHHVQPRPQPQFAPQQIPQGFNRFVPRQPQVIPQLTAQQVHQLQQQQFHGSQQRQGSRQFITPQYVPQQFAPQQFAG
ncbi:tyrosine-protein phosphatase non-receptor type 23-like [Penaeus vannamei]|uniref:tyrosine-protein phosphatase non-receptor type 23-like n=1 Tax=Penaeus vannamei TaxID=6689 RepID=UPI00387FAC22